MQVSIYLERTSRQRRVVHAAGTLAAACALATCGSPDPSKTTAVAPSIDPPPAAVNRGVWSIPFAWPHIAIHLAVLPTGNVMTWSDSHMQLAPNEPTGADIWNPVTREHVAVPPTDVDIFCAGQAFLPDGSLFVTGGHIADNAGVRTTRIFDVASNRWTSSADMNDGRWYPTNTTLPGGAMLVLAGTDEAKRDNPLPQVWQSGAWRDLRDATLVLPYYPRAFVTPDGLVAVVGPGVQTMYLNTAGTGRWTSGPRMIVNHDRDYGSAVILDGRVLQAGGGDPPTATAEVLDLNAGSSARWTATASMVYARRQLDLTILADGKVLATGGTSSGGFNDARGAVYAAEIWDPSTGAWTTVAAETNQRLYHSTAALLPDARVISAGGGRPPGDNGGTNHYDAELYSPPYLFDATGAPAVRPMITGAPDHVAYGTPFTVTTPDATSIAKVTFIRLAAVTHAFDENQRLVTLSFARSGNNGNALDVNAPANGNLAPPGHYMLFLVNATGVPSTAKIVQIE